jgi:hypothetical protein
MARVVTGAVDPSSGSRGTTAQVPLAPAGSKDCSNTTVPTNAVVSRWNDMFPAEPTSTTTAPAVDAVPARVAAPAAVRVPVVGAAVDPDVTRLTGNPAVAVTGVAVSGGPNAGLTYW